MPKRKQSPISEIHLTRFNQAPLTGVLLTLATLLMLSAAQEPINFSFLSWVALVPWVVASVRAKSAKHAALASYLLGAGFYLANLYWLAGVTSAGYIALCLYLGLYFWLCGVILRGVYRFHPWPFTIVLPALWVAQEYLRATVMSGFPWLFLSHGLHRSLTLIQISDVTGAYGVTFLAAMVNGLICDLLLRPIKRPNAKITTGGLALLVAALISGSLLYGLYRLRQGQSTITPGPTLAVIQENIPQYVKDQGSSDEDIFQRHLNLSRNAIESPIKPDLIIWPETMVAAPLNDEFMRCQPDWLTDAGKKLQTESRSYDQRLRQLARDNAALLVGAVAMSFPPFGEDAHCNSAYLFLKNASRFPIRYDKMHLVPFGEVVPFKRSWPWLHNLLNSLTPYDYDYTIDAGENPVVFEFPFADSISRFAVLICYEDVMPQVARTHVADSHTKRVDYLINISNDGWFVRGGKNNQPITATTELMQHLAICQFRAVENRVGVARAVNTGVSAFIRPDGQIQNAAPAGSLAPDLASRQARAGFLTDTVWRDSRVSIYSRIGDLFALLCTIGSALLMLDVMILNWWSNKIKKHPPSNNIAPHASK